MSGDLYVKLHTIIGRLLDISLYLSNIEKKDEFQIYRGAKLLYDSNEMGGFKLILY